VAVLDIMLPFYGDGDYLEAAIRSVLDQESSEWRLTVIDDAYPDPTIGDRVRAFGDGRIAYVRNTENVGITANFNRALALAEAERLVIMGGDDRMLPAFVGRALKLAERFPDAAIIQPGVRVIDDDGAVYEPLADRVKRRYRPKGQRPLEVGGEPVARSLLRGNWMYFPSLVWRRDALAGGFRTDLSIVQDLEKILRIVMAGQTVAIDDEPVFEYRRHRASLSAATGIDGTKFAEERTVFAEAAQASTRLGWLGAARAARRHTSSRLHALTEVPGAVRRGRWTAVRHLLRHAFGPLGRPSGAGS